MLQLTSKETVPVGQLWIDVSASSAKEVESMGIRPGNPVTFATDPFPLRYTHSPREVANASDFEALVRLLAEVAQK